MKLRTLNLFLGKKLASSNGFYPICADFDAHFLLNQGYTHKKDHHLAFPEKIEQISSRNFARIS